MSYNLFWLGLQIDHQLPPQTHFELLEKIRPQQAFSDLSESWRWFSRMCTSIPTWCIFHCLSSLSIIKTLARSTSIKMAIITWRGRHVKHFPYFSSSWIKSVFSGENNSQIHSLINFEFCYQCHYKSCHHRFTLNCRKLYLGSTSRIEYFSSSNFSMHFGFWVDGAKYG